MQITGKKGGEIGPREEKGRPWRLYCLLNYTFQRNGNSDWSATCQSSQQFCQQKKSQSVASILFARSLEIRWGTERCFETYLQGKVRQNKS